MDSIGGASSATWTWNFESTRNVNVWSVDCNDCWLLGATRSVSNCRLRQWTRTPQIESGSLRITNYSCSNRAIRWCLHWRLKLWASGIPVKFSWTVVQCTTRNSCMIEGTRILACNCNAWLCEMLVNIFQESLNLFYRCSGELSHVSRTHALVSLFLHMALHKS